MKTAKEIRAIMVEANIQSQEDTKKAILNEIEELAKQQRTQFIQSEFGDGTFIKEFAIQLEKSGFFVEVTEYKHPQSWKLKISWEK
ncbi:MAG: hypothetical protein ACRCST_00665 [Turicibacter sp.]